MRGGIVCLFNNVIIRIIHAAFKRYEGDSVLSSALKETAATVKRELDEGTIIFSLTEQNEIVAVVKCKLEADILYFSRLSVFPSAQRKGLATQLVHYIEQYAANRHLKYVTCKVHKSENGNIRLYTRLGYQIVEEDINRGVPTVTMVKSMI